MPKNPTSNTIRLDYHANLIIGDVSCVEIVIQELDIHHDISSHGNPDYYSRKYDSFTIENAREIKTFHDTRPVHLSGKKIFILVMNSATVEAQNALLKLLEEPGAYAHFFIIVRSPHLLLPTIKSRLQQIKLDTKDVVLDLTDANKFLSFSQAKRLDFIKALMDDITKEKKSKQDALEFLNSLEKAVYDTKGAKAGYSTMRSIEFVRKYINDRSPSLKMLYEYVALTSV